MATSALGYQSFYQAQLTSNIDDTELIIPLDTAPIPDEGFLVIESTVASKREIIYYTSKTSNSVTCPAGAGLGRGYDGTTAVSHLSGAAVIMAPVAAMFESLTDLFTTTPQGWTNQTPAISAVVANGNRSYTLTHASSIASVVSPGMRRRFTRTVAANTYMGGAFNGSSHYFTKTTPSGTLGTVTNNFTIEAYVQPTSYASGAICARADATPNNQFYLSMEATGQIRVAVANGGAANVRYLDTYQSIPLNKKTHIAVSWTSGTVVMYFDGVSVPVNAAVTGGTAPTTAGTGGDFSIGRRGGYAGQYFPGYISNVAVFDAVLSATTIKNHSTIKLLGSETNCIGAWALDNAATDQSSAGNNLTATGGVGYTNISPFGNNGVSSTLEYGLTMSVSSDGLTEVVQCPEGCALPTTGGITASAYSSMANPYGWVSDKGRWVVATVGNTSEAVTISGINGWYGSNHKITVPIGTWELSYSGVVAQNSSVSGIRSAFYTLSNVSTWTTIGVMVSRLYQQPSATIVFGMVAKKSNISIDSQTAYTLYGGIDYATGSETWTVRGDQGMVILSAAPSGL